MNNKRQRNKLFTMLLLVMALIIPQWGWAQTASQPSVGDGSTDNPYIITKAEELAWFRNQVNMNRGRDEICAKIADDVEVIDLKDFCHKADPSQNLEELSWVPIGNASNIYKGTFDENGKTITNPHPPVYLLQAPARPAGIHPNAGAHLLRAGLPALGHCGPGGQNGR